MGAYDERAVVTAHGGRLQGESSARGCSLRVGRGVAAFIPDLGSIGRRSSSARATVSPPGMNAMMTAPRLRVENGGMKRRGPATAPFPAVVAVLGQCVTLAALHQVPVHRVGGHWDVDGDAETARCAARARRDGWGCQTSASCGSHA